MQLTLVDDIDKCLLSIKEAQEKVFVEGTFTYKLFFHGLHQFKYCMKEGGVEGGVECDILKLASMKKRMKRYEMGNEGSKVKMMS